MNGALEIPLLRLAAGYVFVAIVPAIAARWKVGRTWEIVVATLRMTVQILSGSSPVLAIRYQIAIMLGILGSVTITVFLMTARGTGPSSRRV